MSISRQAIKAKLARAYRDYLISQVRSGDQDAITKLGNLGYVRIPHLEGLWAHQQTFAQVTEASFYKLLVKEGVSGKHYAFESSADYYLVHNTLFKMILEGEISLSETPVQAEQPESKEVEQKEQKQNLVVLQSKPKVSKPRRVSAGKDQRTQDYGQALQDYNTFFKSRFESYNQKDYLERLESLQQRFKKFMNADNASTYRHSAVYFQHIQATLDLEMDKENQVGLENQAPLGTEMEINQKLSLTMPNN